MHIEEKSRKQYSKLKTALKSAKCPVKIPKVHGKLINHSKWSSAIFFWIFNMMVNRGIRKLFDYNGALWIKDIKVIEMGSQDLHVLSQVFNNKGKAVFLLNIPQARIFQWGFGTTRLSGQKVFLAEHWPSYMEQIDVLNLLWSAKVSWLQLHFATGIGFEAVTNSLIEFAEAIDSLKLTSIEGADNMAEFGKALRDAMEVNQIKL
ncbi:MAG: hypothetical protein GY938_13005 [Ketobacter sp.]|nr:hypothetical protein [Ketobacter sp.]